MLQINPMETRELVDFCAQKLFEKKGFNLGKNAQLFWQFTFTFFKLCTSGSGFWSFSVFFRILTLRMSLSEAIRQNRFQNALQASSIEEKKRRRTRTTFALAKRFLFLSPHFSTRNKISWIFIFSQKLRFDYLGNHGLERAVDVFSV